MNIVESMIQELQHESAATHKLLERVPEEHFGWRPHEKSMTLNYLASHVSEIPSWVQPTVEQEELALSMETYVPYAAKSTKELVEHFDNSVATALEALKKTSVEHLDKPWRMTMDGRVIIDQPRVVVLRGFIFNHAIHHRAQLGVFLRLLDIPLPAIYGPSADDRS